MRDIEKMNMSHGGNQRRIRRRRRGSSLYALLVIALTFAIVVFLSTNVFFNIQKVRITGNAMNHDKYEIVKAIGIERGDNMMRLHIHELEEKAEETLIDVEQVKIQRQFPDTLVIDVQKSIPAFNVKYDYGTLIVSQGGKILDDSMNPGAGLISVSGYSPAETAPGKRLSSEEERCDKIFSTFQDLIRSGTLETPVSEINMTDLNDIKINFDHRIDFSMGNWSEISYKINFAEQVISRQPEGKEGCLTMIGNNQCSFRNKADVLNAEKRAAQLQNSEAIPEATEETAISE